MAALSDSIQARLRELADTFTAELPSRMQDIADSARRTLSDGEGIEELRMLRHHTHKLAGSAATFGFHLVTSCSKRLEHLLDAVIEQGDSPDESQRHDIRMLVSELAEAARVNRAETSSAASTASRAADEDEHAEVEELEELVDAGEPGERVGAAGRPGAEERRVVIVLLRSLEAGQMLGDRFSFYGFETTVLGDPGDLIGSLCPDCHTALVMDVDYIERDPTIAEDLHALVSSSQGRLHIVYVSDRDDFTTRLLAVRTAGTAFFSSPLDVTRVIDAVDGVTSGGAGEPYHIMIVDDDAEQVSYYALLLQRAGMITSVVSEPRQLFAVLIESKPDLILMDMYMPGCSGPELATMIRQQEAFVGVPIVFLSVETDEDKQFEAVSRGGDGFLCKPIRPEHLVTAVANRVERTRSMRFFMERDSLTGLLNHTHLMENLSNEVQRAERVGRPLCFVMIDIDHFKRVNDTFGHLTGDRVLKTLARLLTERLRKTDVIGRYGGEEFGVVMFNVDVENATRIINAIREDFSAIEHEAGERRFSTTFSAGIAAFPAFDGPGPISEAADRALYLAKEKGRNRVVPL